MKVQMCADGTMNAQCSSQSCAVELARQTMALEDRIASECPLCPEFSRERIRFSAHQDGDSARLLQWTPYSLSWSLTCAAGSWVKPWSLKPGFRPYVSWSLSIHKHSSVSQHSSVWHSRRSPQWLILILLRGLTFTADFARQTRAFEAGIASECPLCPEFSQERIRSSVHQDGDSARLLQWTPFFILREDSDPLRGGPREKAPS
jgi:hypothetical protein